MPDLFIRTRDDVMNMLDVLLGAGTIPGGAGSWDELYTAPVSTCQFLVDWPDENLAAWFGDGLLAPGHVLELGCGHGRNAAYLASLGCSVDAVDSAPEAIQMATKRAGQAGAQVNFLCCSIFDAELADESYDLVYDSGCFHHLPPHRRPDYIDMVRRVLKPGGGYGLVCHGPSCGSGYTDRQVYQCASLGDGLSYSEQRLRALWDTPPFSVRVVRAMTKTGGSGPYFGEAFLLVLLAAKEPAS